MKICQDTRYIKKNSLFENKIVYEPAMQPFSTCKLFSTKSYQAE